MKKIIRLMSLILIISTGAGCAHGSLYPKGFQPSMDSEDQGRALLLLSLQKQDPRDRWSKIKMIKAIASDIWVSPGEQDAARIAKSGQQLQFAFDLTSNDTAVRFLGLDNTGQIFGLDAGKTYSMTATGRRDRPSARVKRYLTDMRNYLLWPQTLIHAGTVAYLGSVQKGAWTFDRVYINDEGRNEFIVWINRRTSLVEDVEFNLRAGDGSRRGVLEYTDFRETDGIMAPHQIILRGRKDQANIIRRFCIELLQFDGGGEGPLAEE